VYALTETALWLLCGVHPFRDLPILELRAAKRAGQIRSDFWRTREDISDALQQVLRRGLETEPGNRYATAGDFATAFATAGRTGDKVRRRFFWR